MIETRILLVCFYLLNNVYVLAQNPIGLRAASYLRGVAFGTAVRISNLRQYAEYDEYNWKLKSNFQLVVPEGEFEPPPIWRGEHTYNFNDSDFFLGSTPNSTGWVQENFMQTRGHTLVWARDKWIPQWLLDQEPTITPEKVQELLRDYIHTFVGRYRGKIPFWIVVNEAIDTDNTTNPFNLRDSFWLRKLGPDYIKYAFQYAQEADPDTKLYYNEFDIENAGLKATRCINLLNWVRSQGATVHGVGLQWHITVTMPVTPGDGHYVSAQNFIDNKYDIMVSELDICIPTRGGYPLDPQDLDRQSLIYRAMLDYVLHFSPNCKALFTWGFTDLYSWIPEYYNNTQGIGLPFDYLYLPKPAFWQLLEGMTRVVDDGVYRLSPQSQPSKCLGISQNTTSNHVQLYSDDCNKQYQQWNITWQGDGTYRFSSQSNQNLVLSSYNTTAAVGGVEIYNWSANVTQEWAFSSKENGTYHIAPRTSWWRIMFTYDSSDAIGIIDPNGSAEQSWILTKI